MLPALDEHFWQMADRLVASTEIVIERPKGSTHPRFSDLIYPLDYGYLQGTRSNDGGGIDIWRGSLPDPRITGAVLTVDMGKGDAELKFLVGCTDEEAKTACAVHNGESAAGVLVSRHRRDLTHHDDDHSTTALRRGSPVRASARALIQREGKLLCVVYQDARGVNYQLPGGGIEPGEFLPATLERELYEELGLRIVVHGLVAVCESVWPDPTVPDSVFSQRWNGMHRLDFVVRCDLADDLALQSEGAVPDRDQTGQAWKSPDELAGLNFYPRSILAHLDEIGLVVRFIREN